MAASNSPTSNGVPPAPIPRRLPRALRAGDTVSCVAPAGIVDGTKFTRACQRLEARGLRTRTYRDVTSRHGFLAGDDLARSQELMQALLDPDTAAVLPIRGGYGCTRIVSLLDFSRLTGRAKVFAGFSDNTVLHSALQSRCGWVTFHAPHLADGIGTEGEWPASAEASYWGCLGPSLVHRQPPVYPHPVDTRELPQPVTSWGSGSARGELVGGNLSVLTALVGTPFAVPVANRVLLLEDLGEAPYRIDRYLSQWRLAGLLQQVSAVVLGQFTDCDPAGCGPGESVRDVLADYFASLEVPVLVDFPVGHVRENLTLPLGAVVEVDASKRRLTILEAPCANEEGFR